MAQEIERKFLVSGDGWKAGVESSARLQQGYLSTSAKATVRVRIYDDREAVLTLKGKPQGLARAEFEYPLPLEDARELMEIAQPNVIEKRRYNVPHGAHMWEVDVFEGHHEGLIMAEVEMSSVDEEVVLPSWVGREVSDDDRYANASLSRTPGVPD
ncbi:CYTH domain-containing protein [Devosia sp.]|jgi:CYTH domain-containing protein|uniref:CYTH domain-containing protein n=1 Tax=Devosia sp. TaxID=1871048 RepID=UPI001AC7F313|nr:CYTH domain-containing protein [Devosia sp.]MBN9332212.1 CYTH domain-containing protein [Devosia sp.]